MPPRPRPQLVSFLGHLFRRRSHEASDLAVHHEHDWRDLGVDLPPGLTLEWLGTSGFRLTCDGYTLLIDPYVSRLPLGALTSGRSALPDPARVARLVPTADAILVGHSHFDHVLDAPAIAAATSARVYGSASTCHLMALHGLAERAAEVEAYDVLELGPFEVTFVPSAHSRLYLGLAVPSSGDITCDHLDRLSARSYGCGQVFGLHIAVAGRTFYHQGSAELVDDAVRHRGVDYFLCGIAGRGFSDRYLERVLPRLEPRVVVPCHHDDFFRPLDSEMGLSFNVDLTGCVADIGRVSRDFAVRTLQPLTPIGG